MDCKQYFVHERLSKQSGGTYSNGCFSSLIGQSKQLAADLQNFQLNGQAMAVPSGYKLGLATLHGMTRRCTSSQ
jgi:hypothetical protein